MTSDDGERIMADSFEKRFDPRMHTAEHVVNQTMDRLFGCGRSFSAHIEKKKSKLDYHFERALRDDEVREIERRVNAIITNRLPVSEQFMEREEAMQHFSLDRLPEDCAERIRIVRIGDYDACPCIGPHVTHTGEIGPLRIISTSFEDSVLRIRYTLAPPLPDPGR
jgi:Ser-tRNA(Ala) deacylase AlaX